MEKEKAAEPEKAIGTELGEPFGGDLDVTGLLADWSRGDRHALDSLMPHLFERLKRQAIVYLKNERPGHTLQPTALVHEMYLKLIEQRRMTWQNRGHFFAMAARLMRRILVDYARGFRAEKRGGNVVKVQIEEALDVPVERRAEMLALDEALDELAELDARQAQIVELRFFGGLTVPEAAEALGFHPVTITREWRNARAWLLCRLCSEDLFRVA